MLQRIIYLKQQPVESTLKSRLGSDSQTRLLKQLLNVDRRHLMDWGERCLIPLLWL